MKRWLILTALTASAGIGWFANHNRKGEPFYQFEKVASGEVIQLVTANGQLNPVLKVEVGSQISGFIQELSADYNSTVKQGQVIAQIDSATYEANRIQAEGNLASAKAALELAQINANRAKALLADHLISQSDFDKALADLHQAEATVTINEGALEKARVDLARCGIHSPIDGIVISRNVNVGQTVAASLSAPTLFVIANDLAKMRIEANVAEADIGSVEVGQEVNFTVDAFPGQSFQGKVAQIRNAPTVEQNVVSYVTVIEVNNPNLKLKPGMTANVSIVVARHGRVLKVPNAALRFRPPATAEIKMASASTSESKADDKSEKTSSHSKHKKDKRKSGRMVYISATKEKTESGNGALELQAVQIKTGLTDGHYTEVTEGLTEGDDVVIGMNASTENSKASGNLFSFARKKR